MCFFDWSSMQFYFFFKGTSFDVWKKDWLKKWEKALDECENFYPTLFLIDIFVAAEFSLRGNFPAADERIKCISMGPGMKTCKILLNIICYSSCCFNCGSKQFKSRWKEAEISLVITTVCCHPFLMGMCNQNMLCMQKSHVCLFWLNSLQVLKC